MQSGMNRTLNAGVMASTEGSWLPDEQNVSTDPVLGTTIDMYFSLE